MESSSSSSSTVSYGEVIPSRFITESPLPIEDEPSEAGIRPQPRTLEYVRQLTAETLALRAIQRAETIDGSKVGVVFTLSHTADKRFLKLISSSIKRALLTRGFLFAVGSPSATPQDPRPLLICGSSDDFVKRAGVLVGSKFLGRITETFFIGRGLWVGAVRDLGGNSSDEAALWDVVRKAARSPIDPLTPPPGSTSVAQLVSVARAHLERITPQQAYGELHDPTSMWPVVLVDIRPEAERRREGGITGSIIVERNVLEWRFDPRSDQRLTLANRYDLRIIVFCQDGYASSLAARSLQDVGMLLATDMIGGYAAWREAGLPFEVHPALPINFSSSSTSEMDDY
ncbi:uncharacterized protein FIBRA_00871 [Fibroporia radiculosa]|uniref:Rhodanese domain-containing protein n=1 Tax=Fibroporia radiculosa TaxID=599839 RepID=J4H0S6_9APHY|nr:uncharacterized protein FIBRA_00871 [Fibroporia radiculosa]CCL98864.1 predicted protein [Fibroporia radiculosa]